MTATGFGSISSVHHRFSQRCCPVFASNRLRRRRFGPFWVSEGLNTSLLEINQLLQVVVGGHHRHRKVCPRLTDGAQQLAAHLLDGAEHMLNPRTRLGDALIAPLLARGQRLVTLALSLDLVAKPVLLEPGFARLGRVAAISIDVPTRVAPIEDLLKVLAVVRGRRASLDPANELVLLVDVDRELVAEVALAVLLRPGRIDVLLAALGRLPVGGHRTVLDQRLLAPAVALLGRGHQRRIDDLTAPSDVAVLEQLGRDSVEQDLRARFADAVLERPHRRSIRNIDRASQPAEALVAHPVKQLVLHLFVRQVVQPLQHQNAYHRLGRIRRTTALRTHRTRRHPIHFRRQRPEVDVRLDFGQWISERVDLLA